MLLKDSVGYQMIGIKRVNSATLTGAERALDTSDHVMNPTVASRTEICIKLLDPSVKAFID